ncbi:MAG TPA: type II toxin-antitoxin system ParD family antitoxin [Azospirillaceae bacterium]|nr:type II toxin-antitoxin system ParD family antitoxin [Azospirillaceae bacterium]
MGKATLTVSLPDGLMSFIEDEVASGRYGDASAVILEGLRLLRDRRAGNEEKTEALRTAVMEGYDDLVHGRYADETPEQVMERVLA